MSKSFKRKLIFLMSFIALILMLCLFVFLRVNGILGVYMRLEGNKTIKVEINEPYEEKGIMIKKNFHTIENDIKIQSNVNTAVCGQYEVSYIYENQRMIRKVIVEDTIAPEMRLIGEQTQIVFQNEAYEEQGVEIKDNSSANLQEYLMIQSNVDTTVIGEYQVTYQIKDAAGNYADLTRQVKVVENPMIMELHYHYDAINNDKIGWWFKKATDHERKPPTLDEKIMKETDSYYLGADEKVIYLTFDEGGNDKTYIKEITDILNRHDVKATYFLTRNYILNEAELMRSLVAAGHEIGNHTRTHPDMTSLANETGCEKFVSEITETQKAIYEVTKTVPPKIFRFPKGDFSLRSLHMVKDLGYMSVFWSHAYNDYGEDVSYEEAYNNLVSHLHNGAVYLLHPANKGNYEAMDDFISEAQRQGYRFDIVSHLKKV